MKWLLRSRSEIVATGYAPAAEAASRGKKAPYAQDMASRTPRGCADSDTDLSADEREAEALLILKGTKPTTGTPTQSRRTSEGV